MLVRDIMHSPVITADQAESLARAYEVMQKNGIRHLPIMAEGRLTGVVTDRDLRLATSALHPHPFPSDTPVAEVMSREVVTTTPLEPVEEAARLMRDRKIGCLPVLEGDTLTGIITGPDLLDAIIRLTGLMHSSGRLAVELSEARGEMVRLVDLISAKGIDIHSILSYPDRAQHPYVILRVGTLNTHPLAVDLRTAGFTVVWPPEKKWSR